VRQNPIQRTVSLFICVCIALCTIVAHNIAQNRPDSFPPYHPDNHYSSDDVYLREGGDRVRMASVIERSSPSFWRGQPFHFPFSLPIFLPHAYSSLRPVFSTHPIPRFPFRISTHLRSSFTLSFLTSEIQLGIGASALSSHRVQAEPDHQVAFSA